MPLYLLPNVFDDAQSPDGLLPSGLDTILQKLNGLVAESERTGRRYLLKILPKSTFARELPIVLLNEHSTSAEYETIGSKIFHGETWGLISDSGMPGIADPGSRLVHQLRKKGVSAIRVLPGPSSILLALIASGLDGQKFSFQGYLPKEPDDRKRVLKEIERESARTGATQICIETPYRNAAFVNDCLTVLNETTQLCIACRLTYEDESVEVHSIQAWRRQPPTVLKEPTVFVIRSVPVKSPSYSPGQMNGM